MTDLDADSLKARKRRNLWLGLALAGFVVLIGAVTMVRIGAEATKPDSGFYYRIPDESQAPPPDLADPS